MTGAGMRGGGPGGDSFFAGALPPVGKKTSPRIETSVGATFDGIGSLIIVGRIGGLGPLVGSCVGRTSPLVGSFRGGIGSLAIVGRVDGMAGFLLYIFSLNLPNAT